MEQSILLPLSCFYNATSLNDRWVKLQIIFHMCKFTRKSRYFIPTYIIRCTKKKNKQWHELYWHPEMMLSLKLQFVISLFFISKSSKTQINTLKRSYCEDKHILFLNSRIMLIVDIELCCFKLIKKSRRQTLNSCSFYQ